MVPLIRAVMVWTVVLANLILPQLHAPERTSGPSVTQLSSFRAQSILETAQAQRQHAAQAAQVAAWSHEFDQAYDAHQAQLQAQAEATAEAAYIAALSNHPPPPPWIALIITNAFSPLGPRAVQWAINVAYCESRYHPNSVNSASGAAGLFQFLPSTWAFTPWHAQSPFDPVANSDAAAWLYRRDGPSQWVCQG